MAKDYFQDIMPPHDVPPRRVPISQKSPPQPEEEPEEPISYEPAEPEPETPARSIRNINVTPRAPRRPMMTEMREGGAPPHRRGSSKWWLWLVAFVLIAVVGLLAFLAMRPTTVRVVPRSHTVVFDSSMRFTAYPEENAPEGTLAYVVAESELQDSAVVPASGTEHVSEKAGGTITVVNNYSAEPVKLVKNTRFETPDGLIFRINAEVSVPGKTATKPGELVVQVTADQPGEKYNVGPTARFTLPGLKSTPDMYTNVYARSTKAMAGGFVGERPAIPPAALESAKAAIHERIESQARTAIQKQTNKDIIMLTDLMRITYTSLPPTPEGTGNVRIQEKALIQIPVFAADAFAKTVARGVSADAEESSVVLDGVPALVARDSDTAEGTILGGGPVNFTLEGKATLLWQIDAKALGEALAGREEGAFDAIVAAFPGIEEAYARIQPFWKSSFPTDPADIQITIETLGDDNS